MVSFNFPTNKLYYGLFGEFQIYRELSTALTNPSNKGWAFVGLDLNSGWAWVAT
jgi:hypothetical protein